MKIPTGRKDLTPQFWAEASPHQQQSLQSLQHRAAAQGAEYAIYACHDRLTGRHEGTEDVPLRNRVWIGKFDLPNYPGGGHFTIDSGSYDRVTNLSFHQVDLTEYDFGHELYPRFAPSDYRTRVEAERAELYDDDDEDDYIDDDDDEDLF